MTSATKTKSKPQNTTEVNPQETGVSASEIAGESNSTQADQAASSSDTASKNDWPDKIFWSGLFIGGGLLLLLINLGYLPWPDWQQLWKFWPVIFIIIGLNLLASRWPIAKWIGSIGGLCIIFGIIIYAMLVNQPRLYSDLRQQVPLLPYIEQFDPELEGQINQQIIDQDADYSQATSRIINIDMGAGSLEVKASDSRRQVELRSRGETSDSATSSKVQQTNDQVVIDLSIAKPSRSLLNITDSRREYVVTIGQATLPTELNLEVGAGQAELDFSHPLALAGGSWQVGAGRLIANLYPESLPQSALKLEVGVGQMIIRLPQDVGLQVTHEVGLGKLEVFGQTIDREGIYTTSNYQQATHKIQLVVEVGVGNLQIQTLP